MKRVYNILFLSALLMGCAETEFRSADTESASKYNELKNSVISAMAADGDVVDPGGMPEPVDLSDCTLVKSQNGYYNISLKTNLLLLDHAIAVPGLQPVDPGQTVDPIEPTPDIGLPYPYPDFEYHFVTMRGNAKIVNQFCNQPYEPGPITWDQPMLMSATGDIGILPPYPCFNVDRAYYSGEYQFSNTIVRRRNKRIIGSVSLASHKAPGSVQVGQRWAAHGSISLKDSTLKETTLPGLIDPVPALPDDPVALDDGSDGSDGSDDAIIGLPEYYPYPFPETKYTCIEKIRFRKIGLNYTEPMSLRRSNIMGVLVVKVKGRDKPHRFNIELPPVSIQ